MAEWARVLGIEPRDRRGEEVHREAPPRDADPGHAGHEPRVHERAGRPVPGDPRGRDRGAGRRVRRARRALLLRQPARPGGLHAGGQVHGLPARLPAAQAVQVRADGELRRDATTAATTTATRDYDEVFISQSTTTKYSNCYKAYPDPTDGDDRDRLSSRRPTRACARRTRAGSGDPSPSPRACSATRRARSSRPSSAPSSRGTRPSTRRAEPDAAGRPTTERRPGQRGRAQPGRGLPELPVAGCTPTMAGRCRRPPRRRPGAT